MQVIEAMFKLDPYMWITTYDPMIAEMVNPPIKGASQQHARD
jgi:hypothetical protein